MIHRVVIRVSRIIAQSGHLLPEQADDKLVPAPTVELVEATGENTKVSDVVY